MCCEMWNFIFFLNMAKINQQSEKLGKHKNKKIDKKGPRRFKTTFLFKVTRDKTVWFNQTRSSSISLSTCNNDFNHCFSNEKKIGQHWFWKLEHTSVARAQAFNKLTNFLKSLSGQRSYYLEECDANFQDESGLYWRVCWCSCSTSNRKEVGALTSAKKGYHVTVVCGMGTNGNYFPHAIFFLEKKHAILMNNNKLIKCFGRISLYWLKNINILLITTLHS